MPQPDARKFLFDILQSCRLLTQFLAQKTLDDYLREPMLRSAVERQFEIIGEALNQALRVDPGLAMEITDVSRIIAFRNRLAHAYASVSDEVVWGIVEASLPRLSKEVADALASTEDLA
ncbi:MAG: DUF86 domain-containing protein [bacterium]